MKAFDYLELTKFRYFKKFLWYSFWKMTWEMEKQSKTHFPLVSSLQQQPILWKLFLSSLFSLIQKSFKGSFDISINLKAVSFSMLLHNWISWLLVLDMKLKHMFRVISSKSQTHFLVWKISFETISYEVKIWKKDLRSYEYNIHKILAFPYNFSTELLSV